MSLQSNPDPGRTLGQFGLAVLALVLAAAGLFWAIDLVSDDATPIAAPSAVPSVTPSTGPTLTPSPEAPEPTVAPTTEPTATADPTETSTSEASDEPTDVASTPDDVATSEPDDPDVDLSETSVQVLDAIKDGGDRAQEIADELEDDGYRVVAFGPSSIEYENTTVFWTEGHEDEANRLADDNGWDEIVLNEILSETVDVHVVVGLDEQE